MCATDSSFRAGAGKLLPLLIDGKQHQVAIVFKADGEIEAHAGGNISWSAHLRAARDDGSLLETAHGIFLRQGRSFIGVGHRDFSASGGPNSGTGDAVIAPMHGRLSALFIQPGDKVIRGQRIAIVEAMKMEHVLVAPRDGIVASAIAQSGTQISQGAVVATLIKETNVEKTS